MITITREDVMGFLLPNVVGVTHHQVLLTENIDLLKAINVFLVAVVVATSILVNC